MSMGSRRWLVIGDYRQHNVNVVAQGHQQYEGHGQAAAASFNNSPALWRALLLSGSDTQDCGTDPCRLTTSYLHRMILFTVSILFIRRHYLDSSEGVYFYPSINNRHKMNLLLIFILKIISNKNVLVIAFIIILRNNYVCN